MPRLLILLGVLSLAACAGSQNINTEFNLVYGKGVSHFDWNLALSRKMDLVSILLPGHLN